MTPSQTLFILGAGGHGRVVAEIAEATGWDDVRFLDNRWPGVDANLHWPVVGRGLQALPPGARVFVAIGLCGKRMDLLQQVSAQGHIVLHLIHPTAFVSRHATLEAGTVIMPQAAINAGAVLGRGVIVNTGATVDHDCRIGDGVHISPGVHLAGGVSVGEGTWIGIGAVVREGIQIGANAMVGAGAAVVSHVPDGARVVGVPAREVR